MSKGAPPEAAKWLEFFTNFENQSAYASRGIGIPVAVGADASVTDPNLKMVAEHISKSDWHQVFFDQAFGSDIGNVINDISAELATGDISPKEAAEKVQEAWDLR